MTRNAAVLFVMAFAATLVIGATAPATASPAGGEPLTLGATAPLQDVEMVNVDGKQVTIEGARGTKGTMVVFTCNACPWAQAWEKRIAEIGNAALKKGVGVIAINSNDPAVAATDDYATMKTRAAKLKLTYPYVVDATSDVARAFGATRTPEVFLFDAGGKLVYHGTIDDNAKEPAKVKQTYLKNAIQSVAIGKPVAVAETKAFGCSIKFRGKTSSS